MKLTLLRRSPGASDAVREDEEIWPVRVGRLDAEGLQEDIPASLLSPDIDVVEPYPFNEFRLRVQRLVDTLSQGAEAQGQWTALPLNVRHAQGLAREQVAIRARQAAIMAAREFVRFAQTSFAEASDFYVKLE